MQPVVIAGRQGPAVILLLDRNTSLILDILPEVLPPLQ